MEKICNLYISDEHLLISISEYLKREMDRGTKIIVLTQDSSRKSIRDIKDRTNKRGMKGNLDFLNNIDIKNIKDNNKVSIVLKGDNEFIENMENKIKDMFKDEENEINIVSCYDINRNKNIQQIVREYKKILNTSGIVELRK